VEDLAAAFAPGRAGGLVSASRSIADAYRAAGGEPAAAALAEAERLRETAWELSGSASLGVAQASASSAVEEYGKVGSEPG